MRAYASMYRPFRQTAISGHTRLTSGHTRVISGHKMAETYHAIQLSVRTFFTAQLSTFHGFYRTNNMDRLTSSIPHQVPPFKKGSHRELTLREAAHLQSPAELIQVHCRCKGNCTTVCCKCFKAKAECILHCHGRDGGAQCINTGPSAAPSGTFC